MRRRQFITLFGTAVAWPLLARAENSTKRPIIAVLTAIMKESNSPLSAFVQGLNEFGYVDNVDIVYRFAEGHLDRFPVLAGGVGSA
jgi:putative tryptophan/tyrosine transport system substrate-binding protein